MDQSGLKLKECVAKNYFSYFSSKTYVVGTQKNRLNKMVLLSTQKYVQTDGLENIKKFYAQNFVYLCLWPVQEILLLIASTSSKGSDEPANTHSLARASASCIHKVWK